MKIEIDLPDPPAGSVLSGFIIVTAHMQQDKSVGVTIASRDLGPFEMLGVMEMGKMQCLNFKPVGGGE